MTVVSSKEFSTNQKKYFDMAVDSDICIKSDKYMFHLICQPVDMIDEQVTLQPDDDFRRAISKDELLKGIYEDIAKRFAKR